MFALAVIIGAVGFAPALAQLPEVLPHVHRADFRAAGVEADLVRRPNGQDPQVFVAGLLNHASGRSGLMSAIGQSGMAIDVRTAANGDATAVYYRPKRLDIQIVCRIRTRAGLTSEVRSAAIGWCANQLGMDGPGDDVPTFSS